MDAFQRTPPLIRDVARWNRPPSVRAPASVIITFFVLVAFLSDLEARFLFVAHLLTCRQNPNVEPVAALQALAARFPVVPARSPCDSIVFVMFLAYSAAVPVPVVANGTFRAHLQVGNGSVSETKIEGMHFV